MFVAGPRHPRRAAATAAPAFAAVFGHFGPFPRGTALGPAVSTRMYSSMVAIRPKTAAARVLVADDQPDVLEA